MATIDWERAERLYRQGEISTREIARREGVSEGAVRKRAKAEVWSREPATFGVDMQIEAAVLALRSVRIKGPHVDEKVFQVFARAAVKAADRARQEDFQRRARLRNRPSTPGEPESDRPAAPRGPERPMMG